MHTHHPRNDNATADALLTIEDAAQVLAVTPRFLDKSRWAGTGPRYVKLGKLIRYRREDLNTWIAANSRAWTRDAAA